HASSHTVTVRAVDADGLAIERELTVTVGDVNESPAGLGFVGGSVSENAPAGTAVATASAMDPDAGDTLSYSLSDDAGGRFAIDASTGEIVTTGAMDHEDAASHTVTVRAVDADGLAIERELMVTVGDVNESPEFQEAPETSLFASQGEAVVLDAVAVDVDGDDLTYTWRQISGPDVEVSGGDGSRLEFVAPNLEATGVATFEVTVSDGEQSQTQVHRVEISAGDAGRDADEQLQSVSETSAEDRTSEPSRAADGQPGWYTGGTESIIDGDSDLPVTAPEAPTPARAAADAVNWVASEIEELAALAGSVTEADIATVPPGEADASPKSFAEVFEDESGSGTTDEGETIDGDTQQKAGGFTASLFAMLRAGLGIQNRQDEEGGERSDRFKR
ncbi:MAG: cadherin domain-containing protein, partial [Planctomycetota bacterium]